MGHKRKQRRFKGLRIKNKFFQLTIHDPTERPQWIGPVDKFIVEHFKTQ
jgi:hypothetical protein